MNQDVIRLRVRGMAILTNPLLNKGTAFTQTERDQLGLNGLLPSHVCTLEQQLERSYRNFNKKNTPLGRYSYLMSLLNRNELLFYQFVERHAVEMLPYIYTPTVGDAAVEYSLIYNHQRGTYLSYPLMNKMEEMIANMPQQEVEVIVVTDGERILGLGDQGIGGMTIPIGKLSLYTLFGGIHPSKTLPIILDVGTNNPEHLQNELYVGWRHKRLEGPEYDHFVDRFVKAIKKRYPKALLQWEDFGKANAYRLLDKYRRELLSFNDDIQGTGAVAVAALFSAVKVNQVKLTDQRIAILGGGSAGLGIANMIVQAMIDEGLSRAEAVKRLYIVDVNGLLHTNLPHEDPNQKALLHPIEDLRGWKGSEHYSLMDVIVNARPTVLIGVCGQTGAFTKEMITEMAKYTRPIVFPLSNPTSKAECTAQEVIEWTGGRAIIATGSPFVPVDYKGRKYVIAQCNNVYIFPGVGLGALAAQSSQVTDEMFLDAARALANFSPALKDPTASLFPSIPDVRNVSRQIAIEVAKRACKEGVAKTPLSDIERRVDEIMWKPHYPRYEATS